ncbi:MAG TPA: DUF2225 domain-containing protein [Methanocella sp.]|nr:DUF2225 domain-containing protein [Methanocella sp.]
MTTLQTHRFTCPLCGNMFDSTIITSTNTTGPMHSDMYREASGAQPICFFTHTCNNCGYSGFDGDFQPQPFSTEFRRRVTENITPEVRARQISTNGHYYLVALCAEWQRAPALGLGRIYHMGAWCHRSRNEPEKEKFYLDKAAEYFERGIASGESSESRAMYTYIVGDIHRRLGDREKAVEWYRKAIEAVKFGGDSKIGEMAEKQISDPKDIL